MPEYTIKTVHDRNLVIEADRYHYNATEEAYEFFQKDEKYDIRKIATVFRSPEILSIVENDAQKSDFYYVDDWNEEDDEDDSEDEDDEDCDETCLDCRLDEFVGSDTFFDAVSSILGFYLSPADTETEPPAEEYPIEHWKDKHGKEWWGFHTDEGFVHFATKIEAEESRLIQISDTSSEGWAYLDLTGATRLED